MKRTFSMEKMADQVGARLRRNRVSVTLGGEPSYVPMDPAGAEWTVTAVGPTKLRHANLLAEALMQTSLHGAVAFFSPGKSYPGETNPRWAVNILWNRDGSLIDTTTDKKSPPSVSTVNTFKRKLLVALKLDAAWIRARDVLNKHGSVWVLPLDHDGKKWAGDAWPVGADGSLLLVNAEGPAGLRLPMNALPANALKRALVLEIKDDGLHLFFPPLVQPQFLLLLKLATASLRAAGIGKYLFEGYIPNDDAGIWEKLALTPDPGVLEINLPPCATARDYSRWMQELEKGAAAVGLRSFKQPSPDRMIGTGGGNHLLFGSATLEQNPFFKNPRWITSILRYWQHHPSLSYLFTGDYVGPSSQAPRADESSRELYDLEMAYQFLENLETGVDQRHLISETLRHLHTDGSGNTHRSEISFDKFWNAAFEGGCRGLIEFRAIETMPRADWMSAVAVLWHALAAFLLETKFARPLIEHGSRLHDHYFLPTPLWEDLEKVLRDLRRGGFDFDAKIFRDIWEWRFPRMLTFAGGAAKLDVRKACEGWPLLCETPLQGGSTSRFVDTSMERIEFMANRAFAEGCRVFVQGRELKLEPRGGGRWSSGLRFRRSALYPSLHPGITPHLPLMVTVVQDARLSAFKVEADARIFHPCEPLPLPKKSRPCQKLRAELETCDLRLP